MGARNAVRRKRRPIQPGDRLLYQVPPGPPAEVLALYGNDAQGAITAALTLLALALRGALAAPGAPPPPAPAPASPPKLAQVLAQDFFGDS